MAAFTLHDLQCFDAVVQERGFQPAAAKLHRSHPAVFAAVARLEQQLGLALLDRSGYRVALTEAGRSFHEHARALLRESEQLQRHATQLAIGEESELRVVIGDLCPLAPVLAMLGAFFSQCPHTRLHLQVESVTGPWERLREGDADLMLHRRDENDANVESLPLYKVQLVPVVAPGFLAADSNRAIRAEQLRGYTQCVIRDSARNPPAESHLIVEGAPQCTVPDQNVKKEVILQGIAWGHLPRFMIERELTDGMLLSIASRSMPERVDELVAARRSDRVHGPVAKRLWNHIRREAPRLRKLLRAQNAA
jgi:DNA-binding transcriptional LysR family regulator